MQIETGFLPGRDTWNLPNYGSFISPYGFCNGIAMTEVWYFGKEKPITGDPLWQEEYDNGLVDGKGTEGFWQDDKWAIQLCSVTNSLTPGADFGRYIDIFSNRKLTIDRRNMLCTMFALQVTKQPQLLHLFDTQKNKGHAVVCYGYKRDKGDRLFVVDPNFPDRQDLYIEYDDERHKFIPYLGAPSIIELAQGNTDVYDQIGYAGGFSWYDSRGTLQQAWRNYTSVGFDDQFPSYEFKVTEVDLDGNVLGGGYLDVMGGYRTKEELVKISIAECEYRGTNVIDVGARLKVFRFDDLETPVLDSRDILSTRVELKPGENLLGLLVEAKTSKTDDQYWWVGFEWVTFYYDYVEETAPPATIDERCMTEWDCARGVSNKRCYDECWRCVDGKPVQVECTKK
jgi:hypothetical protein